MGLRGPQEILGLPTVSNRLAELLAEKDADETAIKQQTDRLKRSAVEDHFKNYNTGDQNMLVSMMQMYCENVPADQQPEALKEMVKSIKGIIMLLQLMSSKSAFTRESSVNALLENQKLKPLKKILHTRWCMLLFSLQRNDG